jgi:hypothetical protein
VATRSRKFQELFSPEKTSVAGPVAMLTSIASAKTLSAFAPSPKRGPETLTSTGAKTAAAR